MKTRKFKSEFILQKITEKYLNRFKLQYIASEFQYKRKRFDTLAFDESTNSFVIIEYKNKIDCNVLNQSYEYFKLLKKCPKTYIDKYNDVLKTDKKDFNLDKTKMLVIDPKFSEKQVEAAKSPYWPFEIIKVSLNEDNCVSYENLCKNEIISIPVSDDDLIITDCDMLKNKTEKIIELYNAIICQLKEFNDLEKRNLVKGFSLKVNGKFICNVEFLKYSINVYFYTSNLDDDVLNDISNKKTAGNANYEFKIKDKKDIKYFIELFKQAHAEKSEG